MASKERIYFWQCDQTNVGRSIADWLGKDRGPGVREIVLLQSSDASDYVGTSVGTEGDLTEGRVTVRGGAFFGIFFDCVAGDGTLDADYISAVEDVWWRSSARLATVWGAAVRIYKRRTRE